MAISTPRRFRLLELATLGLMFAACFLFVGCDRGARSSGKSTSGRSQRLGQQGALLSSVAAQLRDLPNANVLELRPPVVVLDKTSSGDNQDVMAIIGTDPNAEADAPQIYNHLSVPASNARFRGLPVKSGDIVKMFQLTRAEEREEEDDDIPITVEKALDLTVAQVIDDKSLLIEGGLNAPVTDPLRIEVWRFVDDRMVQIVSSMNKFIASGNPAVGWEPTPDQAALAQIVERLNQWLRGTKSVTEWKPEELIGTLPEELRTDTKLKSHLEPEALGRQSFEPADGRLLQEAIWSRDISRWARGTNSNRLAQATSLFDWVIRNVQLEPDKGSLPRRPWQSLAFGRGTAAERAWVFALLCRQAGIDAAVLTATTADGGTWMSVAVSIEDQLYLFDPRLGLPIPGPDVKGVATLAQLLTDDAPLRQLDTDAAKYPLSASDLAQAKVNLIADPFSLSQRAALLEEKLAGEDAVKLSAPVDAQSQRFREMKVGDVQMWNEPFQSLQRQLNLSRVDRARAAEEFVMFAWRPELWKARTLHFRGKKESPEGKDRDVLADPINDHRDAQRLYMSKSVRPTDAILNLQSPEKQKYYANAKICATYWLGLLTYDESAESASRLENALRWLEMVPKESQGTLLWPGGVVYNSSLTLARLGRTAEAIERLKADTSSQQEGNEILAKQWEASPPQSVPAEKEDAGK